MRQGRGNKPPENGIYGKGERNDGRIDDAKWRDKEEYP
jgi:hypothetical protein